MLRDGCIVLALAFLVHGVGAAIVSWLGLGPETWGYQLKALVKHSGELAGWLLVAAALTLLALEPAAQPKSERHERPAAGRHARVALA